MKPSFLEKLKYRFDNMMSRGTPAMIGMLFVLSLAVVFVGDVYVAAQPFQNGILFQVGFLVGEDQQFLWRAWLVSGKHKPDTDRKRCQRQRKRSVIV